MLKIFHHIITTVYAISLRCASVLQRLAYLTNVQDVPDSIPVVMRKYYNSGMRRQHYNMGHGSVNRTNLVVDDQTTPIVLSIKIVLRIVQQ